MQEVQFDDVSGTSSDVPFRLDEVEEDASTGGQDNEFLEGREVKIRIAGNRRRMKIDGTNWTMSVTFNRSDHNIKERLLDMFGWIDGFDDSFVRRRLNL